MGVRRSLVTSATGQGSSRPARAVVRRPADPVGGGIPPGEDPGSALDLLREGPGTPYRSSVDVTGAARRLVDRPQLVDAAIAVVLTVMAQAQAGGSTPLVDRLLLLVVTGAVAWRRRAPFVASMVVSATIAAMALTPEQPSVFGEYLAVMLTAYTVAERCELPLAVLGGVALVGGVVAHDLASPVYSSAGAIGGDLVVPVLIWGVGRIVHVQYRRVDQSRTGRPARARRARARSACRGRRTCPPGARAP